MAGLRKLKGKYYSRIWYKDNGKRREKLIPLRTNNERRARKLNKEIIEPQETAFKKGAMPLDEIKVKPLTKLENLIDEFYEFLKVSGRKPKTLELKELALRNFYEIYQESDVTLIENMEYTEFLKKLRNRYPCNNTCNIRLKGIRHFFNWCKEKGKIENLPFKIKLLPTKRTKPRYFSDKEMELILEKAKSNNELYARIYTHWKTGLRRGEIHNTYFEKGFIKTFEPIKNGKERSIPIEKETRDKYFIAKDGKYTDDSITRKFRNILKGLGLYHTKHGDKRSFHCLRNTFAVKRYYETRDIFRVKVLLGHSSVKQTEKYADFDIAELEQDFNISLNKPRKQRDKTPNSRKKGQRRQKRRPGNNQDYQKSNYYGFS